jgi:hypothetical protein
MRRAPSKLQKASWGDEAFSYEATVQPVWDAKCVSCHNADDKKTNLTATLDKDKIPASYRTLISGGWVHYFSLSWGERHYRAAPMSFGSLKSKIWPLLDAGHHDVQLTADERERIKCWTDLNCPLWSDYQHRPQRRATELQAAHISK